MKIIEFIKTINYRQLSEEEIAQQLFRNGYTDQQGKPLTREAVKELIEPIMDELPRYSKEGFGECGINREKNPCGDASDY